jgi:hypothetical protein
LDITPSGLLPLAELSHDTAATHELASAHLYGLTIAQEPLLCAECGRAGSLVSAGLLNPPNSALISILLAMSQLKTKAFLLNEQPQHGSEQTDIDEDG